MGAISIQPGNQYPTATGGLHRDSTVTVPGSPPPAAATAYWLGVRLQQSQTIVKLTLVAGHPIVPGTPRNPTVEHALNAANIPGHGVWWGFEIPATSLPGNPSTPFNTVFEFAPKLAAPQAVEWRVVKRPGPFNTPSVPEAAGSATIQ